MDTPEQKNTQTTMSSGIKIGNWQVSLWTLVLIIIVVSVIAFFLKNAFMSGGKSTGKAHTVVSVSPDKPLSVLSIQPAESTTNASGTKTYNVFIDTDKNLVTTAHLELSYDPKVLTDVSIVPGPFFKDPLESAKSIDSKNGKITYTIGVKPSVDGIKGTDVIAQLMFKIQPTEGSSTSIDFLPTTSVSAQNVTASVLRAAINGTVDTSSK